MTTADNAVEAELLARFRARIAGLVLIDDERAETCFVAFEANLAPLVHSHGLALSPAGDLELAPDAKDLFGEISRRLVALKGIFSTMKIPEDYTRTALRAWARAHFSLVKEHRPGDLLEHTRLVEEQARMQKGMRKAKRSRLVDALHVLDAPGIVKHSQVSDAAKTPREMQSATAGTIGMGLGELFVRLAKPEELKTLGARPQAPGLGLAEKIQAAKKRAENAERDGGMKIGTGNERRRVVALRDDDLHAAADKNPSKRHIDTEALEQEIRVILTPDQWDAFLAVWDTGSTTEAGRRLAKRPTAVANLLTAARRRLRKHGFDLRFEEK